MSGIQWVETIDDKDTLAEDGLGWRGAAILAADICEDLGLHLPDLSESTIGLLKGVLPAIATPANPLDTAGDTSYDLFKSVADIVLSDPGINALLVIYHSVSAIWNFFGDVCDLHKHSPKTFLSSTHYTHAPEVTKN